MEKEEDPEILRAIEQGVAQLALEGIEAPPEAVADLHRVARGELTLDDVLRKARERFFHGGPIKS